MIRALLVDDERLVREGLRTLVESARDICVVGELDDGSHIAEAVLATHPDVALVDLSMPQVDGIEAIRRIGALPAPRPAVVVLTTFDTDRNIVTALQLGALGFLRKDASTQTLIAAVRLAARGDTALAGGALAALLATVPHGAGNGDAGARLATLTGRDRSVAGCVARGLSNAQIARELFLSEATVKSYVSRILTKLSLDNRVQLAILWARTPGKQPGRVMPSPTGSWTASGKPNLK